MSGTPKIVVLGMMTKMPVAGIVWLTMPYLVGLRRLGYDVYYVEAHARTPSMLMESADDDGASLAAAFIDRVMRRFGFAGRWAYHALHERGGVYGMTDRELRDLYRSSELIINLHGGTEPLPEHTETGRLVLVETDPVELEIELHDGDRRAREFIDAHCAVFTWGENFGNPDCRVPLPQGIAFRPTRMPIVLDHWQDDVAVRNDAFTTIGNWEQAWRDLEFDGEIYSWSKHHEFLKVMDLPQRTDQPFELALESCPDAARDLLKRNGWRVRRAIDLSDDIDVYRDYILSSLGEFTVAKDQNVRLRSGWFSDRSASYLAAGKPVITQETGFSNVLPTGAGLFGFSSMDDILAAVESINGDYDGHARAAREIAREYFDANKVLRGMLAEVGLPFPPSLSLKTVSRAPTTLEAATVATVVATPLPPAAPSPAVEVEPEVSVIVVTFDGLAYTRLCLESVLLDPSAPVLELIVVDNASTDGTRAYLHQLAARDRRVRLILNAENRGFAPAVNQGLAASRGNDLVLLNNDTIPPPGAIARLVKHLCDLSVGLVGPVSNRTSTVAEVETAYTTMGGLLEAAKTRASAGEQRLVDVPMLTMFCVALRRGVYEHIGRLDERFHVGLFEDDDYSLRVRWAGFRVVFAEDVLVHHFGEASFGHLVSDGEHARIFEANRRSFEEKWGITWSPHPRPQPESYTQLVDRVLEIMRETVPLGANVLVVSRGDGELLRVEGRRAGHFPQLADGVYAGHYPADVAEVIAQLEVLEAEFLVFPRTSLWWLDHYDGLRDHLDGRLVRVESACSIFALGVRK